MGKSLLTIDTLIPDRDFIEVNVEGKTHKIEMRTDEEMSLQEIGRIARAAKLLGPSLATDASEEVMGSTEAFANDVLRIVLVDPPAEVIARLTIMQKFQIVNVFTRVGERRRGKSPTEKSEALPTGDVSSPGSEGSTAVN